MFWTSAAQRGSLGLHRCWSHKCLTAPRCPLITLRSFCSGSVPETSPTHNESPLQQWALSVSPFTTVRAKLGCSITVHPLDPHAYPEADRAFITVLRSDGDQNVALGQLQVHYDDRSKVLMISAKKVNSDVTIKMDAPIKSSELASKPLSTVKRMECDICKVQTQQGNCLLHSIKSHQVEVQAHGGHVTGVGTIHGNVNISTRGDGVVNVRKLQGTTMNVSTEHGLLKVRAIYAESSCVSSSSGRVELGHVHGNLTVENACGDTVIDGSNSFLKVSSNSGDIDVYVGDGGAAELYSQEGDVSVRVPSSLRAGVDLCGASVDISPEVVLHGVENNTTDSCTTISAQADRGSVKLRTQSWFESLNLGS
uniref:Family with sequence similarity 185 member A n=1 Tax=Nothobranchius furzeri TaxID=105023 RepID=A0A8C6PE15_NOTFU